MLKKIFYILLCTLSFVHAIQNNNELFGIEPINDEMFDSMTIKDFAGLVSQNDQVNIMIGSDVNASTTIYMFTKQPKLLDSFKLALSMNNYQLKKKSGFFYVTKDLNKELSTFKTYQLRSDIYENVKSMFVSVQHVYIPTLNKLVFKCSDEDYNLFKNVLKQIDELRQSYNFKVTVFDLDSSILHSKGFDTSVITKFASENTSYFIDLLRVTQSKSLPYLSSDTKVSFYSFIDFLNSNSAAKIEVSTIINTLDNVSSKIENVTRVPVLKSSTTITEAKTNNTNSYDYENIGSVLELKPHFLDKETTYIDFKFKYSLLVDKLKSDEGSVYLPSYNEKLVNNIIRLKRGQAVLVGGFKKVNQSVVNSSVPLLGDVPFIGNLFKNKKLNKSTVTTYILIEYMAKGITSSEIQEEVNQFTKDEILGLF
jgi:general secretion pathway protein D